MTNLPFLKLIGEHRGGDLEAHCSAHLRVLLESLALYGGAGTLDLKLKFTLNKFGQVEVAAKVASKPPRQEPKPSIFYLTDSGELSRRDPAQADIEDIPGVRRGPREASV